MRKLILVLAIAWMLPGCAAISPLAPIIGIGVQAYLTWKDGEATAYYACDSNTAYQAVKRVLIELNYSIESDKEESKNTHCITAKSHDNNFKVTITKTEDYVTAVKIRIDIMGNKPYAELIYKKLERQLDVIDFTKQKQRWHLLNTEH